MELKKISANHISNKRLVSKIYKEPMPLNNENLPKSKTDLI